MPTIRSHYGITGPVPFVDVEVETDNRLYVDPHAIRLWKAPQPFVSQALDCIDTFTQEVTNSVIEEATAARPRGKQLLQQFAEPWETRLGMSAKGFRGHGGAVLVGTWIWETLSRDVEALVRFGILQQLEDLPLFVKGVDRDITSDITTRIIFGPLAQFTEEMLNMYPQFTSAGHKIQTCRRQVWNPRRRDWDEVDLILPVVKGKSLLLVPREWVRPALLMSAKRYYETSVLSFAQLEQAVRGPDGKLIKSPKKALKRQPGLERGRGTNMRVTLRAFDNGEDLLGTFKGFVAARLSK